MIYKLKRLKILKDWKIGKRLSLKDSRLSDDELQFIYTLKQLVRDKNVEILVAPISSKRYVIDKKNDIYIIMENNKFEIITTFNKLVYYLPNFATDNIWIFIDNQIEKRRNILEKDIHNKIKFSMEFLTKTNV